MDSPSKETNLPNNLTSQQSSQERPFQAIDGTELKRIILSEISKQMDKDSKFLRHLTYPVFSFAFNIVIHAYPMEPPEFNVEGRYRRAPAAGEIPKGDPEHIELEGRLDVDAPAEGGLAPDQARERAGLSVPMPAHAQLGKSGTMTVDSREPMPDLGDKPRTDPATIASGQVSAEDAARLRRSREPKNRPGASPNFARSVDLATRAAPEGARVDDNIGTVKGD